MTDPELVIDDNNTAWVDRDGYIMIADSTDRESVRFGAEGAKRLQQWLAEVLRGE